MALDNGFVAAVLDGIEGTLGELIERVETSELHASLDVLQSRVTALRKKRPPWKLGRSSPQSRPKAFCLSGQPQQSGGADVLEGVVRPDRSLCVFTER